MAVCLSFCLSKSYGCFSLTCYEQMFLGGGRTEGDRSGPGDFSASLGVSGQAAVAHFHGQ